MHFYQVDNLHAVIARLVEIKASENDYERLLSHLCEAGEYALKEHTETAYNTFMDECGVALTQMKIEM